MVVRRVILVLMLVALGLCALAGMFAAFTQRSNTVWSVLWGAVVAAVGLGAMLPLTLLIPKPKYRAGAFCGMATIGMTVLCIEVLILMELGNFFVSRAVGNLVGTAFLVFLYGVPSTLGLFLVQFRWARVAAWGLGVVMAMSCVLLVMATLASLFLSFSPNAYSMAGDNLLGTSGVFFGMGFLVCLLLVNVGCGDSRHFRYAAITIAAFDFVLFAAMLWRVVPSDAELYGRTSILLLLTVIFFAHLNMLLTLRVQGLGTWARAGAIACAAGACSVGALAAFTESEINWGIAGALGIVTGCATLAVIALALLNRRIDRSEEPLADAELLKEIDIACPRCKKRQTLPLGDTACGGCGLKLILKAIEPRCVQCGYLLYGTTSDRCPECGKVQVEDVVPPAPAVS